MQEALSRRKFFNKVGAAGAAAGVAGLAAPAAGSGPASGPKRILSRQPSPRATATAAPAVAGLNLNVTKIENTFLTIPFRPVPGRRMFAENFDSTYFLIHKVTLACGVVGFGEIGAYRIRGTPAEQAIAYAQGRNAAELMWDDSLGMGLQMALFDAVGKANDVPMYRLLGPKVRDRAFISWWDLDMAGEDWVSECREAMARGYTAFKTKGRPWRDIVEDCRTLCKILPPYFTIDMDFNDFLLDVSHATQVMQELAQFPNIVAFESPIPQGDVWGNRFLRSQTRVPIAMHYGLPPVMTALKEDVCDVFVVGGSPSALMQMGAVAAMANKPFWLQLTGSEITTVFTAHFAAVLSHATWPAVNCPELHVQSLIKPGLVVTNGTIPIPERPGLGVDLDEDAVAKYRMEPLAGPLERPEALIAVRWPGGSCNYFAYSSQYWTDFKSGRLPLFVKGVRFEYVPNNGSREWKELQERAKKGTVFSEQRVL